jgi:hypothetical protein
MKKMSRIHIKDNVIAYLEKTLSPEKHQEIEKHLSICESCRLFLTKIAAVYFSNDRQIIPEVSPYFYTRVRARLEKEPEPRIELPVSIIKTLRPVAAGLFVLTAITFSIFLGNYILSTNQINTNAQVNSNEMNYEYYLGVNGDPMVNLIISNEN